MKYGNMGIKRSVSIRQGDLEDLESFHRNRIFKKFKKTKILNFGAKSFVK